MPKHDVEIKDIEKKFDEIEQYSDQLNSSIKLAGYDRKFHVKFTKKYSAFIRFLLNCNINNDIKVIYLKKIQDLYEQR